MRDWESLRARYEAGQSLRALARADGVPYSTLRAHAVSESWRAGRREKGGTVSPEQQAAKSAEESSREAAQEKEEIPQPREKHGAAIRESAGQIPAQGGAAQTAAAGEAERPEQTAGRLGRKLLGRFEQALDAEGEIDLRDLKTAAGALREICAMLAENGGDPPPLTVRFVGEAEEMSL